MTLPANPLLEFIPQATLQRILDTFAAVTGYAALVSDRQGHVLSRSSDSGVMRTRTDALRDTLAKSWSHQTPDVSIRLGNRTLALLRLGDPVPQAAGVPASNAGSPEGGDAALRTPQADAVQFLYLLGDTLAQVCRQGVMLRHRLEELTTLFQLSKLLAGQRSLQQVLDTVVRSVVELLNVKAATIRLLDDSRKELFIQAVYNLSPQYLEKGPIRLVDSDLDRSALAGEVVYVQDMANDPRVLYPDDAKREGIASILVVGMIYHGQPIGIMRIYTEKVTQFSENRRNLLVAIAQLAAGAIHHARLDAERSAQRAVQRQIQLAADVQRRLLPQKTPVLDPFDFAGIYEPCFDLGGDFYDFIPFEDSVGVVVGDVVGKGIAASLLMASVRAALRAHVEDVYDLDEVMGRVNNALTRDTRDNEFATVFYGTLDAETRRLTYCSAGHDPALLWRDGEVQELTTGGMVLGILKNETYEKGLVNLQKGDVLLVYSDGVVDASNFHGEKFGRDRVRDAVADMADRPARDIVNHVLWQVRRFAGLNHRPDDMTIVAVKVVK
ncbi:SpoIIE family protein phosphatase [Planctomycetales bacterium ZRK34]|nr:SpoIIE family protein phosphatase [Planctomycetales bacterium ZRK34]